MNNVSAHECLLRFSNTVRGLALASMCFVALSHRTVFSQGADEASFQKLHQTLHSQMEKLDEQREYAKADRLMKRLVDTAARSFGDKSTMHVLMLNEQVTRLWKRGERTAAFPLAVKLLPLLESQYDRSPDQWRNILSSALHNVIIASEQAERPVDHSLLRRWLEKLTDVRPESSPGDDNYMGLIVCREIVGRVTGDQTMAIDSWRQRLSHYHEVYGAESVRTVTVMARLARELVARGNSTDISEARQLADRIASVSGEDSAVNTPWEFMVTKQVAFTYACIGDEDKAKSAVNRLVNTAMQFDPNVAEDPRWEEDPHCEATVIPESEMADLLSGARGIRDRYRMAGVAIPVFRYVLSKRLEKQPEDAAEVLQAKSGLGRALILAGQKDEGIGCAKEAYDTATKSPKELHVIFLASMELTLAIGKEYSGLHEEACEMYSAVVQRMETDKTVEKRELDSARREFALAFSDALEQNGRADEARELRQKAGNSAK